MNRVKVRYVRAWADILLAIFAAVGGIATVVYPRWFEAMFEASPDAGSGALEWMITIGLLVVSVALGLLARRDFRRHRAALAGTI
jgi:TRAP-type mannitol/chloroaromatic compound transport system permease small subunit